MATTEDRQDPLETAIEQFVQRHVGVRVLVAFSGGVDSTVLLHALSQQLPAARLVALHVNHSIQAESDAWAQFRAERGETKLVRSFARRLVKKWK